MSEKTLPRLQARYREEIIPTLMEEFEYSNLNQVPTVKKVVVNIGMGEANDNPKMMDGAVETLRTITGQQPIITRARKSIATFKLREGRAIGVKVTLRGERMWSLLDRLMNVALPRIRDFRGVPAKFDGRGNYTVGLREQLIFPEIDFNSVDKVRGMEITLVTSAETDEEGRRLLELLGMPFSG
ncbi:MAG: 50S ribosomal protein L5 [Anaerolineae bacterium]|nr:50S ribosomal protein L5 [Anaerolineae bacterium]MCA9887495.1 50S ribosomal protein L5 [Anaerolineae bacterium]MCA9891500.1 50S ribosomal protein L5 [Anaerolineae bacterium]